MQYTSNYQLNLPQTTDAVRVADFNENTTVIDGLLAEMEISDTAAAEIWGGNNIPSTVTISGALSKLADTVPSTMGTEGKLLMAGANGASWGSNRYYPELVRSVTINKTGSINSLASVTTGWDATNLVGLRFVVDVTLTGPYNNDSGSGTSLLVIGGLNVSDAQITLPNKNNIDTTTTVQISVDVDLRCMAKQDNVISVECGGSYVYSSSWAGVHYSAGTLTVNDSNVVTAVSGLNFGYASWSWYDIYPYATTAVGTAKIYALREVA